MFDGNKDLLLSEYNKHVHPDRIKDKFEWTSFKDSFPELNHDKITGHPNSPGTTIEVFDYHNIDSQIYLEWILVIDGNKKDPDDPDYVCLRRFDDSLIEWTYKEDLYWRYLPEPPGNCGYDVG